MKINKSTTYLIISAFLLIFPEIAMAQTIGDIVKNVLSTGQLTGIGVILEGISYISGIACGIKGAIKLKEHSESKGQVHLSIALTYIIVAGLLLGLPTVINIGQEALYNQVASPSGGTL